MELLADPNVWIAFLTLAALEIVLGIDNIVFISILAGRLPVEQRQKARMIGLSLALGMRVVLLLSIAWIMGLTEPLFALGGFEVSWRDIILIVGGLFLLGKSTLEIHHSLEEGGESDSGSAKATATMGAVIAQIAVLDMVFSLDSVITAVGLAEHVPVMIAAIVVSIVVMMVAAGPVGRFVDDHPTVKMLALSFLILIGVTLIAEGLSFHIPKGYIYFAMGFSLGVEMLNLRLRASRKRAPVKLHNRYREDDADQASAP
ncbi:TerC family protein [Spectribacter hydrogenoxidans]|uniref:TerC family protein n=1 Tax=Spectribacter hydrogenoxidans TaxID=3075608 RepID=A0ABU3C0U6_9GAMM|nr:TerC family protein [Salinisphaera sp. W335]MDT0635178.1 TerC family protein [Salinisphaera sp. W335]